MKCGQNTFKYSSRSSKGTWNSQLKMGITRLREGWKNCSAVHVFTWNTDHIPSAAAISEAAKVRILSLWLWFWVFWDHSCLILSCTSLSDSTSHLWRYGMTPELQSKAWSSPQCSLVLGCRNSFGVKVTKATLSKFTAQPINHLMSRVSAVLFHNSI